MKTLIVILTFFISTTASAFPGFIEPDPKSSEGLIHSAAKNKAISFIEQANNSGDIFKDGGHGKNLSLNVITKLKTARLLVSSNEISKQKCAGRGFFVNEYFPREIFVCDDSRAYIISSGRKSINELAQLLVHEGVHLTNRADRFDECMATKFELVIMDNSIGVQTWISYDRYKSKCEEKWK